PARASAPAPEPPAARRPAPPAAPAPAADSAEPALFPAEETAARPRTHSLLDGLDPDQRAAAEHTSGPLLIVAGPGTGKTRTLTHRIAHLVAERGVPAEHCLAITFTRRAAEELRERLHALLAERSAAMTVTTLHGLGALILREQHDRAGLDADFTVVDETLRQEIAAEVAGSAAGGRQLLARRDPAPHDTDEEIARFEARLREAGLVDFTDLIRIPVRLLSGDEELVAHYRNRWPYISVDEYQDVDGAQYALLRLLAGPEANLTAIG